ncbi:hypothetical protein ACDQ55_17555 [Chitinophaga sp. 30R24]|uniref:hypothetical protein n=1 Tax=Chitinophaga sp. 30R24 TaxID=3248838 RepID=UPI003B9019C6
MKQPEKKYLLIDRKDSIYTRYEQVPGYLQPQLIPYAKCYTDIDNNGVIIDQKIEMHDITIYYHLIHLTKGVKLTTVPAEQYLLPACISGFTEKNRRLPLKITLTKKELNTFNSLLETGPMITKREFVINFHVNLNLYSLENLIREYPIFDRVRYLDIQKARTPNKRTPYPLNEVNYQIMKRIINCRHIAKPAEIFFRRSAVEFYATYLRYLQRIPPVMLMESHREQLRQIASYIIHHITEITTITALCEKFNVAPAFLEIPFEQEFFIPVKELIHQERMALAYKMITETSHTLAYIATLTHHNGWEALKDDFEEYYRCSLADLRKAQ